MKKMMTQFIKYDQDFEYGADLPEIFIKFVLSVLCDHVTIT